MILDIGKLSLVTHNRGAFIAWDSVIKCEWIWRKRRRPLDDNQNAVRVARQATGED